MGESSCLRTNSRLRPRMEMGKITGSLWLEKWNSATFIYNLRKYVFLIVAKTIRYIDCFLYFTLLLAVMAAQISSLRPSEIVQKDLWLV